MNEPLSELATVSEIPDEIFASDVFRKYSRRLLQVAENQLARNLRSKICPEDVVQSAFGSFFRRLAHTPIDHDSPEAIWGLLVVITIRKCRKWEDVFYAEKRNVCREMAMPRGSAAVNAGTTLPADGPGPEEIMAVNELLESLLSRFDVRRRQMLVLRLQGYELNEIAEKCRSSRRTVARTVADARVILSEILGRVPV